MKKISIIAFLYAILFPLTILAQSRTGKNSISGRITNANTGEPLAGASIELPDLKKGVATNAKGDFILTDIPAGHYLLEISFLGYSSVLENIDLNGDMKRDFKLIPTFVETGSVTVIGVSAASAAKRTPIPVSVVKKEDLLRDASVNIVDAISKKPGVAQIATGPAISKPVIRGLGYNRVVVVNDGIRQEGQQWGDEHGIEIDEYNVNKVEILKGPASLTYGSDALAGVVNFISVIPAPVNSIRGNLMAAYQTNNKQKGFHGDINGNKNGLIWGINGSYKAAADYRNKYDGYVYNSKFNERDFGGYLGLNKNWGYSHLLLSYFNQRLGVVEGSRDSATGRFVKPYNNSGSIEDVLTTNTDYKSTVPTVPYQNVRHLKAALDNSFRIGKNRLTATIGVQRNERTEFGNILQLKEKSLYFDLKTVNYNLQYHLAESKNWKTTIGVNGMRQTNANKGVEVLIPEYRLFDIGGFVYSQKRIDKLTLSGGIRLDSRTLNSKSYLESGNPKFFAFNKQFTNTSASAGLTYDASKRVTLRFNAARGFRAPSIPELATNGAHEGTNRYEYGEQNLKSETSLQFDGGIEVATEHVSLAANVFYNNINNFIYYRKLSGVGGGDSILSHEGSNYYAFKFDQQNAHLYGFEANLDIHPHPLDWLHIENSLSYVRGVLSTPQDGSKNLPFIPAARLVNQVKVDLFQKGKNVRNVYLKAELDNTFAQIHPFTGFNTETATPAYSLLNAGLGADVARRGQTVLSVFLTGNNLTDVAYQSHLSRLKYTAMNNVTGRQGVFNMGRNFSIKVNIPISFQQK